jgi:predicted oxidoreductase
MLNSWKKFRTLRDKKKYSNSCVVRKNKFWTKQKTISPPFKLNGRSLRQKEDRIGGVMVRVLASSAVDRGFEPRSGQTFKLVFVASPLSIKEKE